ncbi:secretion-regulating guanine nucleotide exchange factor-like [Corticium candelabrum]|uniref:secretion-regulating guanine nucleotide exchange factor-like n=1 Tax=Corticium candelabrum TaxID=121492 RepID=UPI002E262418|nr:secretion-regulating guanine nucleotide exchange factor-like [Corticium candelabrum]
MTSSEAQKSVLEGNGMCLYAWGANSYSQLCLQHKHDETVPTQCVIPHELFNLESISQITGGAGHTVIVTGDGCVFVAGWNRDGQLGLGYCGGDDVVMLTRVPCVMKVRSVTCGWNHTLAIMDNGDVLAWGSNCYGQLGIDVPNKQCSVPTKVANLPACGTIAAAAGVRHSLAIADDGTLWAWGNNKRQQLGMDTGRETKQALPTQVMFPSGVFLKQVSAGFYHSVAVSDDGRLFAWGCNRHGQCGICQPSDIVSRESQSKSSCCRAVAGAASQSERAQNVVSVPTEICGSIQQVCVTEVYCGWSHSFAVSNERRVFAWGRADYGQLGVTFEDLPSTICTPTEVECLKGVQKMCCGSEHNLAVMNDSRLVSWGWNEHGMCGTGDAINRNSPSPVTITETDVKSYRTLAIGCGAGHSLALLSHTTTQHHKL